MKRFKYKKLDVKFKKITHNSKQSVLKKLEQNHIDYILHG